MKELLSKLGITAAGRYDGDTYIIDIETDSEYNRIFSKLDKSDLLDEKDEAGIVTLDTSTVVYEGEDYIFTLIANFEENTYRLEVNEMKG